MPLIRICVLTNYHQTHADAHIGLDPMIGVVNQSACLSNGMKLADLMCNARP